MKTTRSVHVIAGVACLALAATACGSSEGSSSGDSVSISVITGSAGAYYEAMACGAEKAAKAAGAKIDVQYPDAYDPIKSESLIRSASVKQPDAMVVVPTDATALTSALSTVGSSGTKLVFADQTTDDPSVAVSQVLTDNEAAGAAAADAMADAIGGKGKVIIDGAAPGSSSVDERVNGFKDQMAEKYPDVDVLGVEYSQSDASKARSIINGTLAKHPDLAGVYVIYETGAIGIGSAIKAGGLTGKVKMVGFDTAPTIIEMLEEGVVTATVAQQPAQMGELAVEQALKAIDGEEADAEVSVPFTVVTKDNLEDKDVQAIVNASANQC